MKIRAGFISNSSTSSFLVPLYSGPPFSEVYNTFLTKKQIQFLERSGFKLTTLYSPSDMICLEKIDPDNPNIWFTTGLYEEPYSLSYGKIIMYNQTEEIRKLLKRNIPFSASLDYGNAGIVFPPGLKFVYLTKNFVDEYNTEMQVSREIPREFDQTMASTVGVIKVSIEDYLKGKW